MDLTRIHPKEYNAWNHMRQRCSIKTTPNFYLYGGRGIKVCERWASSFKNFLEDMGQSPIGYTLERKNSNGNYEPSNCKWADRFEQNNNRRNNVVLEFYKQKMTVSQWARQMKIPVGTLHNRLRQGWSIGKSLTAPVRKFNVIHKV